MTRVGGGMYGLSGSGMDVDDMVRKMMSAQQARYDKMYKNKAKVEWQKTAYNDFYKTLTKFRFDTLADYKLQSNMAAKAAKSQDESLVSVKANGDAAEMSHDIAIKQLAKSAYLQSKKPITRSNQAADKSINLPDIINLNKPAGAQLDDIAISFVVKDNTDVDDKGKLVTYTYKDLAGKTLNDLANDLNKLEMNIHASYDADNDSFSINNKKSGDNNTVSIAMYEGGRKVDGVEVPAPSADAIKNTKTLFANLHLASYDSETKQLGAEVNLDTAVNGKVTGINIAGQSAAAIIDGKEYKSDSNQITAGGVTYTLNKLSDFTIIKDANGDPVYEDLKDKYGNIVYEDLKDANGNIVYEDKKDENGNIVLDPSTGNPVQVPVKSNIPVKTNVVAKNFEYTKVNVTSDTEKVVDNVKKFVEDYNKLLDSLNTSIYQEQYKEFLPLTSEEKSAMSEDEIKRWEEKAKSGLLKNDSILRGTVNEMRSAISGIISGIGKYNSMGNIGISTTSFSEHGKIQLDEKKLRNALAEDSDAVYKVFGTSPDTTDANGKELSSSDLFPISGVADRLSAAMKNGLDKIALRGGISSEEDQSVLGLSITSAKEKMAKFQKQMDAYQARLYKQFNAMETAIASLNSQASFLASYGASGS